MIDLMVCYVGIIISTFEPQRIQKVLGMVTIKFVKVPEVKKKLIMKVGVRINLNIYGNIKICGSVELTSRSKEFSGEKQNYTGRCKQLL